ncbi:hypothetical protein GCM10010399_72210 [Dactylosporangium fulvum]|uniref:hypothetical protein n=1 Tax=Dactylosporangium fulvum TaxID=53359 RepID=UPI0029D41A8E|nr:hypothetical protein [Dactylosporangium fulvum]
MLIRQALDALAVRLDGRLAAAKTIARQRAILHNALEYAVELAFLPENPLTRVKWKTPKTAESVDRRGLKHRTADDTRPVPARPELVEILRCHLGHFGMTCGTRPCRRG